MSPSIRRPTAILLLLAAAACSHLASILPWGEAQAPDQARYSLAANGLTRLAPTSAIPLDRCHWFPLRGTDPLCQAAPGQESRLTRLTYASPALEAGAWLSFLATVILLLAGPPAATLTRAIVTLAGLTTVLGSALILGHGPGAVQVLAGLPFKFGGPGLWFAALAPVLAAAGGWLLPASPRPAT